MPQPPARAFSQKDLPPSVESAYYRKCIDIRRRINDIEENNDGTRLRITRLNRGIQKMRLERAFLLEQINKHMEYNADDSDRSSSPPPTPTDKPLRSKRSHNRKATPPPSGSQTGAAPTAGAGSVQQQVGSPASLPHHHQAAHPAHPTSSAQSTPDPSRPSHSHSYFGAAAAAVPAPPAATAAAPSSPHAAVNGATVLPSLHTLPSLQAPPRTAFFDPAYDEQRPGPAPPAETEADEARSRAFSGAQEATSHNGDTEMTDAGFTAVNR